MNKEIKITRNFSSEENKLFGQDPTLKEIQAKEYSKRKNAFYRIISSNKKTLIELLKFNFFPILIKILIKLNYMNQNTNNYELNFTSNYRLMHIEKIFKKIQKIKIIYEFGSGASTIHFAKLLKEQYQKTGIKGKLYTFDQSQEWIDELTKIFPPELIEYVDFKVTEITLEKINDFRFLKYDIFEYHNDIDLVYIDGPTHKLFGNLPIPKPHTYQANGNIIEMMKLNNFKLGFTDKRFYYYLVFKENNFKNYNIKLDYINRSLILTQLKK